MTIRPEDAAALYAAIAGVEESVRTLVGELRAPIARSEDVDLVAANPAPANREMRAQVDEAVQVDNPYAVTLEVRAQSDGGGEVVMRVPAHASRVLAKRVHELSLRAIGGNPAGAIPATVIRFDRPVPPGLYPYAP